MTWDGIDMAAQHTPEPSLAKAPNCPRNGDHLGSARCSTRGSMACRTLWHGPQEW